MFLFLARLDGHFCENEREVLVKLLQHEANGDIDLLIALEAYAANCCITSDEFLEALEKVGYQAPETIPALVDSAQTLIESDGAVSVEEQQFFDALRKEARKVAASRT